MTTKYDGNLLGVDSRRLEAGAARLREKRLAVGRLRNGVDASAEQLDTAARLLKEAEPSVITAASGLARVMLNEPQERPGFIEGHHKDREVLVLTVGILPADTYRIARDGKVLDV